ncbi:phosphodiester glycosidase family protein [Clostridium sp. MSJ-4]|uniref:Phosphodiester glycosidase family protein n=1 Tax=Clostridium simiarum TaxID=2841506 RepID=A0ABS6EY37_9CLOT|nr:phosphodiester glycosidase family protein [Clostridium simiarum]MBU5590272.1 phosphodiester glycosidase family protein [Clostridium simiarum]
MVKKKKAFKRILLFLFYQIVVIGITSPFMLLYGPYKNTRKTVVSTVMATRHQYLITNFLSEGTIDQILGNTKEAFKETSQDINKISIKHKNSDEVMRYDINTDRFDGYLLEIKNPTKVKVSMTKYLGEKGQKTSEMAIDKNAIAAINGGSFIDKSSDGMLYAGTGASPGGYVISNGKVIFPTENIDENAKENVVAFTKEGKLIVGDHTIKDLKKLNVMEAICFRPPTLIVNSERQIKDKLKDGYNPRTAVGQKADGTVLFLVVDGRKSLTKLGASLYDLQEILLERGAINAGNLDGGYSSTMYYEEEVINSPNSWDGERSVATAFYVEN